MIRTSRGVVMGGPRSAPRHHDRHDQGARPGLDLEAFDASGSRSGWWLAAPAVLVAVAGTLLRWWPL